MGAPFIPDDEGTPFVNEDLAELDLTKDHESEEEDPGDEENETMVEDEPIEDMPLMGDGSISDINNTLITSVSAENCKIINESDQHSPCPDPEGVMSTVNVMMNGCMDGDDVVPNAANLTPVKLDPGLKEQDTFTSSPSNSRTEHIGVDDSHDQEPAHLISRRQQRLRIVKCYGAVALIVLVLAIGIPLGAVMLFKSNSTETSYAGASGGNNSPSTGTVTTVSPQDMMPPEEVGFVEVTEAPQEATAVPEEVMEDLDDADGTTDPPVLEEQELENEIELQDDADGTTDPPLFVDEVDTESPFVAPTATDAPIMEDANTTAPFEEKNVTSISAETDTMTDTPVTDAPGTGNLMTDAPEEVTDVPVELESFPSATPTVAPSATPTASPSLRQTMPPGPDRSGIYFDLINITSPAVLQDTSSPQAISYLWMVEKDQLLPVPEGRYLLQRYILVVMDHVFHNPIAPGLAQPMLDHCLWDGIVCDLETGDVKEINWRLKGLNGRLVDEMKHLDSLERLDLSENDLVGSLDNLYGATSLKDVYLHNNKFSGPLKEQVGQMEILESLYLGHNELTGFIPLSLRSPRGKAKPLKWLILSHNQFSGYLPPDWRMRNLFHLDLGHNMLSGPLPNDWDVNMVRLRHLYLDHNQFTGLLPAYLGQLGNGRLKQLHLNDNQLEGKVPENWDPLDQLTNMAVHNNNLTVPVSQTVCEMSVFELGVLVELKTDCNVCTCDFLCEFCVE